MGTFYWMTILHLIQLRIHVSFQKQKTRAVHVIIWCKHANASLSRTCYRVWATQFCNIVVWIWWTELRECISMLCRACFGGHRHIPIPSSASLYTLANYLRCWEESKNEPCKGQVLLVVMNGYQSLLPGYAHWDCTLYMRLTFCCY